MVGDLLQVVSKRNRSQFDEQIILAQDYRHLLLKRYDR